MSAEIRTSPSLGRAIVQNPTLQTIKEITTNRAAFAFAKAHLVGTSEGELISLFDVPESDYTRIKTIDVELANKPAPATKVEAVPAPQATPTVGGPIIEFGLKMAALGIPIFPLRLNSKAPAIDEWQLKATTDEATIRRWAAEFPGCGYGCV